MDEKLQLVDALLNLKRTEAERDTWKAEALGLRETVARVRQLVAAYGGGWE